MLAWGAGIHKSGAGAPSSLLRGDLPVRGAVERLSVVSLWSLNQQMPRAPRRQMGSIFYHQVEGS